jgi:hypothetical protein
MLRCNTEPCWLLGVLQWGPQGGYGRGGMRPYENGGGMGGAGGMSSGGGPRSRDAWIASGKPVTGAEGWTQYETPDTGEKYYHNQHTNTTQWEKPACWVD